ncbi:conserved hypothetical protein [Candidatus Zixiibacteriota bacterium]|nr:conserved hypothetical protein [candidate division Zixibacteria bacterium]
MPKIIDLKKDCKRLYSPSAKTASIVQVPKMNFLMIDGKGDPNKSKDFQDAIESLFSLSYTIKFNLKKSGGYDYRVMPLEGLWWVEGRTDKFRMENKKNWKWTLMIMQPEFVSAKKVDEARGQLEAKKAPARLSMVRFENLAEGNAAQIMHVGPFSRETATVSKLHQFIEASGYNIRGKHHEIYLSDFRRVAPERMKTVIRQPLK